jgi:hypothetical protein
MVRRSATAAALRDLGPQRRFFVRKPAALAV